MDEALTKKLSLEQFRDALGYFKAFHLSDHQLNSLFEHFASKETKLLNYNSFLKALSGEGNQDRIGAAREIMQSLSE